MNRDAHIFLTDIEECIEEECTEGINKQELLAKTLKTATIQIIPNHYATAPKIMFVST
ncbi:MAG: hypothetical protein KAJ14_09760 [Candidatus Omnitrophica bacterium]|nr:hypothetical protein [Candidatus Omnitrophota bacterium]